jgi:hypothetical protein
MLIQFFRANPYQKIIQILGRILDPFTEPNYVYAYGFGDAVSQDISVFNLLEDEDSPCIDYKQGNFYLVIFSKNETGSRDQKTFIQIWTQKQTIAI